MKLKVAAVLVLAAIGAGAAIYSLGGLPASAGRATQYLTSDVVIGDVTDDVAASGTIEPQSRFGLVFGADPFLMTDSTTAPSVSAAYPVTEVLVEVGDAVVKGAPLAHADTAALERELTAASNSLASAKLNLRAANNDREDADESGDSSRIRQAKMAQYAARNQVSDAQLQVDDLEGLIAAASLAAPADGIVTEINISAGFDAPGGPAIVIDSAAFEITTDVVESDLADIELGQRATVTISAIDAEVAGTVAAISPIATADGSVVSYPVTVALGAAPAEARSGMSADVTITVGSATSVLTVPAAALRGGAGNYSVLTLGNDGVPTATAVEVGLITSTAVEITAGLAEGQSVVTGTASDLAGTSTTGGGGFGGVGIPGAGPGGGQFRPGTRGGTAPGANQDGN